MSRKIQGSNEGDYCEPTESVTSGRKGYGRSWKNLQVSAGNLREQKWLIGTRFRHIQKRERGSNQTRGVDVSCQPL